jgi:hypothetical protein
MRTTTHSTLFSPRRIRAALVAALLALPALTLWNLAAESVAPHWQVKIGGKLWGITERRPPLEWTLRAFANGSWQNGAVVAITEAFPLRPMLIKFSNTVRKNLFGAYGAPGIVAGHRGHLIEAVYVHEYCTRDLAALAAAARTWLPKLKQLQDFYQSRGRLFLYVITPSKAAHLPELFTHLRPCPSTEVARREWLPTYLGLLRESGINVVDAASMTHSLKGRYDIDIFPEGGVHWNRLGSAHAADAVLAELNRLSGRPIVPRLSWTYEVAAQATGTDRDLVDLLNLFRPNVRYPTVNVHYAPTGPCEQWPGARMAVAIVGGSFVFGLADALVGPGCLNALEGYNYLYRGRYGGADYSLQQPHVGPDDISRLREVDILILEENESLITDRKGHGDELHRVLLGR